MSTNGGREQSNPNRVFVGGISWKADETSLANFFSAYGTVIECKIIMDKATGKSKGYGFVTFQDAESANNVKQSSNLYFHGKMMNVGDAVRKSDSPIQQPHNTNRNTMPMSYAVPYGYNPAFNAYYSNGAYYQQPFYGNVPTYMLAYSQFNPIYSQQQFQLDSQGNPLPVQGWQPIASPFEQQQQSTAQIAPPSPPQTSSPQASSFSSAAGLQTSSVQTPQAYQPMMQPIVQQPSK